MSTERSLRPDAPSALSRVPAPTAARRPVAAIAAEYQRRGENMAIAVTTDMGIPPANSRVAVDAAVLQFSSLANLLARSWPPIEDRLQILIN